MAQTSSWYSDRITEVELEISNSLTLAGVSSTEEGNSKTRFTSRLKALNEQLKLYKIEYKKAVALETGADIQNIGYLERRESGY